nr:ATP-binding protein [uncultured Cohaesibacter sp.]
MEPISDKQGNHTRSIFAPFLVIAVGLVLCTSVFVGFWQIWQNEKANIAYEDERLQFAVQRLSQDLKTVVEDAARSVAMLGGTPPIQGILNARKEPLHEKAVAEEVVWKDRLAQIFLSLADSERNLLQVRLIGMDGREMIRVNRVGEQIVRVEEALLQDKSRRAYVSQTLQSPKGRISYFGIDHNRELGLIEEPHIFVMRVATRVWGAGDEPLGMIIVNINMSKVIADLHDAIRAPQDFILVNEQGDYLRKPTIDPADITSLNLSEANNSSRALLDFMTDFPDLAQYLAPDESGNGENAHDASFSERSVGASRNGRALPPSLAYTHSVRNEKYVARTSRIHFDQLDPDHFLLAVTLTPKAQLLAQNREMQKQVILFTGLLTLVGAIIAFLLTHHFVKPLRKLTDAARQLSLGASVDSLKVDGENRPDEIGVLLRSVYDMASSLEEKQKSLKAILATAQNPILMINQSGLISEVNEATVNLFGFSRRELIGRNISMLMNEHDRMHHDGYLRNHGKGPVSRICDGGCEATAVRKDGSTIQIHLAVSKLIIKGEVYFTGIMTDLTDLKKVDRLKSEFVSTVSHELRTPLTSIKGALGLIRTTSADSLPDHARKMLDIATSNCERLAVLINDILDLEKIEAGKLSYDFEAFDVVPFLEEVLETNRAFGKQFGVSFHLDCPAEPIWVFADRSRMEQVVTNLISNAVKYSPQNGLVILSAAADAEMGRLRIAVRDFGDGIAEEFRDRVFDKFAQADSSDTRARGGTGLGLAISREIIKAHSGSLDFETETGAGTTFFINLDILPEEKVALQLLADRPASPSPATLRASG